MPLTNTPTGNTDPYVYRGTDVLRNLRDIRDSQLLSRYEMDMTTRRLTALLQRPVAGRFDTAHLQATHRYIFQDVYVWAGELRTVNMARSDQFYFAFEQHIEPNLNQLLGDLGAENHLASFNIPEFIERAAYYMGELNAIHPFRDGNGRAQREFMRQIGLRNGYSLDWSRVSREQMYDAARRSFQDGDRKGLKDVLAAAIRSAPSA